MNARTFAALALSAAVGACALAPVHAQDAMAASSSTAMPHQAMQSKDMMKDSMHKDGMKMKKGAMEHKAMKHDATMMKKDGTMKMKHDAGTDTSSGG